MSGRVAFVNGRYVRHADAAVHIEDRGFQFADGVYEVWAVFAGRLVDTAGHLARLWRSLGELRIAPPMGERALMVILRETLRRNRIQDGLLYLQVNRGVARRDHPFPDPPVSPSIIVTARAVNPAAAEARAAKGVGVVSVAENRWGRCDIKTVGLLPNVLAKQKAREAGAAEAWFVDELGLVTEGASSNAWIVDANGVLRTRDVQANILRGVTRLSVMRLVAELGLPLDERAFTLDEAKSAREAFITGAGSLVLPVVRIDEAIVGEGRPGPVAKRLRELYIAEARLRSA
jgi:D-alanine transaminase